MAHIIILGAGLTGLSVAYHLEQQGFYDYKLIEKESTVGGLCRSIHQDGFTFDYTGHLLHISDQIFKEFVENNIGFDAFNKIRRSSVIYSKNCITPYPFQINLYGLPQTTILECIEGYIQRKKNHSTSFYQWVLTHFGKGFGNHFFFPYQRKIFDYDIRKLTASWTGRFVPKTSLKEIIEGSLGSTTKDVGYNAHFLYPRQDGIVYWVKKLASLLKNPIYTNSFLQTIGVKHKHVRINGCNEKYTYLITTIPLKSCIRLLKESSASALYQAERKLLCNKVINFNLGIDRPVVSPHHWMYFPEPQFPFYRLGFPSLFAHSMAPEGCSSLYGEIAFLNKSPRVMQESLRCALQKTKEFFNLHERDIKTELILTINHAYVIYNPWRDKYVPLILKRLKKDNIWSIGRYGGWKYASMQENFLEGKSCAEELIKLL